MGIVQDAIVRKRKEVQPPAHEVTAHLPSPPPAKSLNEEYTEQLEKHNERVNKMIEKLNHRL